MKAILETESVRVNGLAFHPNEPWLCASLNNGAIQIWDYEKKKLINRFKHHDGPAYGVDIHHADSLIVTSGEDSKAKVWKYDNTNQSNECLFTIDDSLTSVQFHPHGRPWILITHYDSHYDGCFRLWDYETQSCIATVEHPDEVKSIQFHPTEELIISTCDDGKARVWDYSRFEGHHASTTEEADSGLDPIDGHHASTTMDGCIVLKCVLELSAEALYSTFHSAPSPLVATATWLWLGPSLTLTSEVKVWRMTDTEGHHASTTKDADPGLDPIFPEPFTEAREVISWQQHCKRVSGCIFVGDCFVMSASEDGSIAVFDVNRKQFRGRYHRSEQKERFWAIATHPSDSFVAAGHDTGLILCEFDSNSVPREENFVKTIGLADAERSDTGTDTDEGYAYPRRVVQEALDRAIREDRQSQHRKCEREQREHDPQTSSSLSKPKGSSNREWKTLSCWHFLHFCILRPVGEFCCREWILGSNLGSLDDADDEDLHPEELPGDRNDTKVVDADVEDAAGNLYELRILYNYSYIEDETGIVGKVFDRRDHARTRTFADIKCLKEQKRKSTIIQTRHVADFVDHENLKSLTSFLRSAADEYDEYDEITKCVKYESQFEMIVWFILLLTCGIENLPRATRPRIVDGYQHQRKGLILLAKAEHNTVNEGNLAFDILCRGNDDRDGCHNITKTILHYAAQSYAVPKSELDTSLDWFIEPFLLLILAIRLQRDGYVLGARWAIKTAVILFQDGDALCFARWAMDSLHDIIFENLPENVDPKAALIESLEHFKPLTLGLEDNDALFDSLTNRLWTAETLLGAECWKKTPSQTKICHLIETGALVSVEQSVELISIAIQMNHPTEILKCLLDACPQSATAQFFFDRFDGQYVVDTDTYLVELDVGALLLHFACATGASLAAVQLLLEANPDAVKVRYRFEDLIPLQYVFQGSRCDSTLSSDITSLEVARYLLQVWPESEQVLTGEQKKLIFG